MYRRQSELGIRVDEERAETICVPIVKQIKNMMIICCKIHKTANANENEKTCHQEVHVKHNFQILCLYLFGKKTDHRQDIVFVPMS